MRDGLRESLEKLLGNGPISVHLIGVAGSGMSGLARIFLQLGHRVSGSDLKESSEIRRLKEQGLVFSEGQAAGNVVNPQVVIFSSAVKPDNPELAAALERGIVCARRGEILAVLADRKETLVVAGAHGKTTTTSMLAYVMREAGWRNSHYVGAEIPILETSAGWDEGAHFVIEADESDGTLAYYRPKHSLILNIEAEHMDYYANLDAILDVFRQLIRQTSGRVFYCEDDRNTALLCSHEPNAVSYGFSKAAHYHALGMQQESFASTFEVVRDRRVLGRVRLNVPGRQNVSNALGVIALACELGIPFERTAAALEEFRGARRRFEVRFRSNDFMVVDDYAHHPTEILATLAAARSSGWKRLVALFQPHRYSRTKLLREEFATAFGAADVLYLTDVYAASEKPLEGITGETIAEAVRGAGHANTHYVADLNKLRARVSRDLEPGDLVITMGAGNIHTVATALAKELGWYEDLRRMLSPETKLFRQEPMHKHTSLRVGGPAQLWCEPAGETDLIQVVRYAHEQSLPVTVIGRGTNLLVRDGGIPGICIHLGHSSFGSIRVESGLVEAGAGARLKNIVAEAKKGGLGGFEFMEGIPGNLGGAMRMNAGAMQGWTMEVVEEVRSLDPQGRVQVIPRSELQVSYRSVPHFAQHIALSAKLRGVEATTEVINERLKQYSEKRWASQPAAPSAGCIFKNPGPCPAGKLVDELGLKNLSVGKARVSDVHGNFIVNDGGATARDVLELIAKIQEKARSARGIELEPEVIMLGEDE